MEMDTGYFHCCTKNLKLDILPRFGKTTVLAAGDQNMSGTNLKCLMAVGGGGVNVIRSKLVFYVLFNNQVHVGTFPQEC